MKRERRFAARLRHPGWRPGMQRASFHIRLRLADASRAAMQACARQRPLKLVDGYFVGRACAQANNDFSRSSLEIRTTLSGPQSTPHACP